MAITRVLDFRQQLVQFTLGDNLAVEEMHLALGVGRESGIVGHHADGRALFVQFLQQLHHGFAIL